MDNKLQIFLAFSIIISLLLIGSANSFIVYLRPPKMIIYMNVTPGEYSFGEGVAEVKNMNNETVGVEFLPQGNLTGNVIFDGNSSFDLSPQEGRNVTFKVRLNQSGVYDEIMLVKYSSWNNEPVNLQLDMRIIASKIEAEGENTILKYIIIGFICFTTVIIVLFILKRGGKK
ncbi:MAG: hypothetical protein COY38_00930 [Candidatus Aenigmarchaeota archaeon CG_4_10_14_0_8_um_filter_37_24]|nr:hypothetical protein [Candidatus Aenigmarchaeota archaeon]OIN87239.1 MAG: hypothetical protein AUJ50_02980 [Candidatus Aenigmarchaeota archaeon CG1_02_38_14]PIV69604.1 MAG: hypothetical protein COS07_00220 [Candidatus Aenigmarchaeota archaeon CG01_land_8_20_14_3_00_37_9]PIW40807.1 MAG: hypothetical protein COW21_05170 [Candidatus Aenigmarchaeota archaeon CG15_BIG_FIL_POST_REV_8_21_14_020_37_27]PIX50996.1 MAG: hypothetical protein COZ52_01165 [Candidatus Aenigmarchaeota archaeon CG_4_8_14_3_u